MITKGIVEQIDRNNPYTAKVRIPVFNKAQGVVGATPTNQLYTASICCLPNCNPNIKVGDVVYVSFEDNYIDKPIILGHLYNGISNLNTTVGIKTDSVEATVTARLPADTNIGDTTSNDFVNLRNTRSNLQGQIDLLSQNANSLSNYVDIVTAPKPWIGDKDWVNVILRNGNGTEKTTQNALVCKDVKATINLLYIQIENVFKNVSYAFDTVYFNFEISSQLPNTEDARTFTSYLNKKKTLISTQTVNITHTQFGYYNTVSNVNICEQDWSSLQTPVHNGYAIQGSPSALYIGYYISDLIDQGALGPGSGQSYEPGITDAPVGLLFALSD